MSLTSSAYCQVLGDPIKKDVWERVEKTSDTTIVYWDKNDEKYFTVDSILTKIELTYPLWTKEFYEKEFKSDRYRRISRNIYFFKPGRYYAILVERGDNLKVIFTNNLNNE